MPWPSTHLPQGHFELSQIRLTICRLIPGRDGYLVDWARLLAYITGTVDQELLLRNEYLAAENRILKAQIKGRLLLTDVEKATLAKIGYRIGRKALEDVGHVARPDTILGWYRKLVARKFDGSKSRRYPGRPKIDGVVRRWSCAWPERIRAGVMTG